MMKLNLLLLFFICFEPTIVGQSGPYLSF